MKEGSTGREPGGELPLSLHLPPSILCPSKDLGLSPGLSEWKGHGHNSSAGVLHPRNTCRKMLLLLGLLLQGLLPDLDDVAAVDGHYFTF